MERFAEIAVSAPVDQLFTYGIPEALRGKLQPGMGVQVPFGRRSCQGVVIGLRDDFETVHTNLEKVRDVQEIIDTPQIDEANIQWLKWISSYYVHPVGEVFSLALPPGKIPKAGRGRKKDIFANNPTPDTPPNLTTEQQSAFTEISSSISMNHPMNYLLFGVTGSGKTEVYLRSIDFALSSGKAALVLVPEISLTPQLLDRFTSRFGDKVAVIHSHLTPRERAENWWNIISGKKSILIGARSALFCPIKNLGIIILDEEHDSSFKQDEQLRYHAKDAAIMKGVFAKCPVVLGSATPSLESWHNAQIGKLKLLELSRRVENRPLPKVEVIDLRVSRPEKHGNSPTG